MKTQWPITPITVRALTALAAGLSLGCGGETEARAPSPPASDYDASAETEARTPSTPTSDYDVYAAVLREHFINPQREEHVDGVRLECVDAPPAGYLPVVAQTRFRREGGRVRDSALVAELPPEPARLVPALRAMDGVPPRTLSADSFYLGMPVRLVAQPPEADSTSDPPWPVTLSRVAYNADSTWALVHAVQPCRAAYDEALANEPDLPPAGTAIVAALQRRNGTWVVSAPVFVYVE